LKPLSVRLLRYNVRSLLTVEASTLALDAASSQTGDGQDPATGKVSAPTLQAADAGSGEACRAAGFPG
jgi:hypothetical protein